MHESDWPGVHEVEISIVVPLLNRVEDGSNSQGLCIMPKGPRSAPDGIDREAFGGSVSVHQLFRLRGIY